MRTHFRARALGIERVCDGYLATRIALRDGGDEVVVGAAISRFGWPNQSTCATRDGGREDELTRRRDRLHLERVPRFGCAVEVEFDEAQVTHTWPLHTIVAELVVGFAHALRDEQRRLAGRHVRAAAADECCRDSEQRIAWWVPFRHALCPADDGLPHRVHEIRRAERSFFTEPGDDDCLGAWQLEGIVGVLARVGEHEMRTGLVGIAAELQPRCHRAADEAVDDALRAGEAHGAVVAEEEWMVLEVQVAVDDGDLERQSGWRGVRRACALLAEDIALVLGRCAAIAGARGTAPHVRCRGCVRATRGCEHGGERSGRPRVQQLGVCGEGVLFGRQRAMITIDLPRAHSGYGGARRGHSAVALFGEIEVNETIVVCLISIRRERRVSDNEHHLAQHTVLAECRLCVETLAQFDGAREHRLCRDAPVGFVELDAERVPDVVAREMIAIELGQALPCLLLAEAHTLVEETGLELQEARELSDDVARTVTAERCADRGEHVAEGVVAGEHLHGRP